MYLIMRTTLNYDMLKMVFLLRYPFLPFFPATLLIRKSISQCMASPLDQRPTPPTWSLTAPGDGEEKGVMSIRLVLN